MIFIISCARSGSSILAETLGQHPLIDNKGEQLQAFWGSFGETPDHHELEAGDASLEVSQRIFNKILLPYAETAINPLDKCPPNSLRIPFLRAAVPNARFIHLVRDGRDVALSLMPGVSGEEGHKWSHLKPRHWRSLEREHFKIDRCARLWWYVVEKAAADLQGADALTVKYEDLVDSPAGALTSIFNWLSLKDDDAAKRYKVFEFAAASISNDTSAPYHAAGQTFWYRPDHKWRVGRWKDQMTPVLQKVTTDMLSKTLEKFGYESRSSV